MIKFCPQHVASSSLLEDILSENKVGKSAGQKHLSSESLKGCVASTGAPATARKKSCFTVASIGAASALVLSALAPQAKAVSIPLNNPNFDASGQGTTNVGYSTSIGWKDINPSSPGGGVYNNNPVHTTPNAAYTAPGAANGGYQLTNYVLQAGDQVTLTYYAAIAYQSTKASVHLIRTTASFTGGGTGSATQNDPYSATTIIATSQPTTTGSFAQ